MKRCIGLAAIAAALALGMAACPYHPKDGTVKLTNNTDRTIWYYIGEDGKTGRVADDKNLIISALSGSNKYPSNDTWATLAKGASAIATFTGGLKVNCFILYKDDDDAKTVKDKDLKTALEIKGKEEQELKVEQTDLTITLGGKVAFKNDTTENIWVYAGTEDINESNALWEDINYILTLKYPENKSDAKFLKPVKGKANNTAQTQVFEFEGNTWVNLYVWYLQEEDGSKTLERITVDPSTLTIGYGNENKPIAVTKPEVGWTAKQEG